MKKSPYFDQKYLGRVGIGVLCAVLAAMAVIYMGYHMSSSLKESVDIMYAVSGLVPQNVYCDGYILRNETVIEGTTYGALTPTVRDGERVRSGNKVADIYSSPSPATQQKIALVEDQISFYKKCAESHLSVGDTALVNNSLSSVVLALRRYVDTGELSEALALKTRTVLDIRRLGVLTGKVTDYASVIASLESTLASLKASLGSVSSSVYAPYSGYYFSVTDGYEDIFSIDDIDALTYSGFADMVAAAEARETVTAGTLGKMVNDFRWYLVCPMSTVEASSMKEGNTYSVSFENNPDPVDMKLDKVLSNSVDALAVFCASSIPDSFDYTRCQKITVEVSSFTGFRVPAEAIRFYEGMQGVFILDEVTVKFRRISISHEANGYFYCNVVTESFDDMPSDSTSDTSDETDSANDKPYYAYLREHDIIITSGTGLYVGMTLNLK